MAQKMIYGGKEKPTRNVPTSKAERAAFTLSDMDILKLARWAVVIEKHYGCAMDIDLHLITVMGSSSRLPAAST